jgi:AraC-like DNA-binding protein
VKRRLTEVSGAAHDLESWSRLLSSDDMPPFQRLESIADPSVFAGRVRRNHLDQVTAALVELEASEHSVRRSTEHIATLTELDYLVICQLSGDSAMHLEDGRRAELTAGDFTLVSTRQPYTWSFAAGGSAVFSLRFPQELLGVPRQVLRTTEGRTLSSREGFGRHLAPFVTAVARDGELMRGHVGGRLARNLIDLFATSLVELSQSEASAPPAPLFLQVTQYIAAHLSDPELDASAIARASHISVRYLQALFHEQGSTVTDWIRDRRLAGSRRDLVDPALRERTIADIALRWGYLDPAYFSRLFRRQFGESPRDWRARAIAAQVPSQQGHPGQHHHQDQPGQARLVALQDGLIPLPGLPNY